MWTTILSLVLGGVPGIIKSLADAKVALANAETEHEKVAANERIKALEAQKDVLIAESTTPWNAIARFTLLGPVAFYWFWTIVWDKIMSRWFFGFDGSTDKLADWQVNIVMIIIGFYFVADITKIIKR